MSDLRIDTAGFSATPLELLPAAKAFQNAKKNVDKQNARIEHDKAFSRVMNAVLKDDTPLFKQFSDNDRFAK